MYLESNNGGVVPQTINTKGFIINLRCYPVYDKIGGYMVYALLYTKPEAFVKFTMGNSSFPGLFQYLGELTSGSENPYAYKGKKIILVNEVTQSHAEFIAMKYSVEENSIIFGSTTAGADIDVISLKMPGGIKVRLTGVGVYYPDGRETQGVGIVPDIEVKPTIQGIKEGRDEVLEKAIELISEDR